MKPKWAIEVNGPANIVMLVQMAKYSETMGNQAEVIELLNLIEKQARMTITYLRSIQADDPKFWHEIQYKEVEDHDKP